MFDVPEARYCDDFRSRCINHLQIATATNRAAHQDFLKILERANVSLEEAEKWRLDFVAREEAKSREFPKALDAMVNVVLAYRPKPKTKPARRRKRLAAKMQQK